MNKLEALSLKAKAAVPKGVLDPDKWIKEYNKNFAELIVRECAEIADTAEPFLSSDLIKQHFGVK
jgi:hypothetical protein